MGDFILMFKEKMIAKDTYSQFHYTNNEWARSCEEEIQKLFSNWVKSSSPVRYIDNEGYCVFGNAMQNN